MIGEAGMSATSHDSVPRGCGGYASVQRARKPPERILGQYFGWLTASLTVLLAVLFACIWLDLAAKDRAMRSKFDQVRIGMTLAEVEALMGRPHDGQGGDGSSGLWVKGWDGPGTLTIDVVHAWGQNVVLEKRLHKTHQPNGYSVAWWRITECLGNRSIEPPWEWE
jgi:hypothetical protein